MEPVSVPKKVNRHLLKALDYLQTSRLDFVSVDAIQDRVRWSLRNTKPVKDLENVVEEALNHQTQLGIITRYGSSMYAKALGFPGVPPKKVNKHVLKAFRFLQTSSTDFISIEDIQDRVRKSLHRSKPVSNLEQLIKECLKKQTQLGVITRSGSTKYAITQVVKGIQPTKNEQEIRKKETGSQCTHSLTEYKEAKLRKVKKALDNRTENQKSKKVRPGKTETSENSICDKCFVLGSEFY